MRRIKLSFGSGLRRVNTMGSLIFRVERCQWAAKYITFYRLHVAYILVLSCVGTFVLWVVPLSTSERMPLLSALYTSVSVLASTGLQTVDSTSLTDFHNCFLMVLMLLGSQMLTSLWPVFVRRYYFHLGMKQFAQVRIHQRSPLLDDEPEMTISHENGRQVSEDKLESFGWEEQSEAEAPADKHLKPKGYTVSSNAVWRNNTIKQCRSQSLPEAEWKKNLIRDLRSTSFTSGAELHDHFAKSSESYSTDSEAEGKRYVREWGKQETVFVDAQQALRTLEYRALVALSLIALTYLFGIALIGFLLNSLYFLTVGHRELSILKGRGLKPYFYALFTCLSLFTNSGYAMTNDSFIPFASSSWLLLLYALLASAGNTLYSPLIRLLVWVRYKLASDKDKRVFEYLLEHPRRCYTHLFPQYQTLWLVAAYLFMTGIQIFFMCVLEWNEALQVLNPGQKLAASYFQAVSTRNSGGLVVGLAQLVPALLFLFAVCMYMAVYPLFLSRQMTQVQESDDYDNASILRGKSEKKLDATHTENTLKNQARDLLAKDTTYLVLALFILCLSESQSIRKDPLNFSIFNIIFEVTSAYGNIGLSLGYNCDLRLNNDSDCTPVPYSFSGAWTTVGRLVIIIVMFLGRHRNLADNIDSAIRLPTETATQNFTIPPTPTRTFSTVSVTPTIFQTNDADHHLQMELSPTSRPSSPIHKVSLSISFVPFQSHSSPSPPTPNLVCSLPPDLPPPSPAVNGSPPESSETELSVPAMQLTH